MTAYLNALAISRKFIYIEDQYFIPNFSDAAFGSWPWADRESPMSELKKAIARGVQLLVVLPSSDPNGPGIRSMRDSAVDALRKFAERRVAPTPIFLKRISGESTKVFLRKRESVDVHIHSKLLICDDEYAIVGSGNLNARSFTNDAEIALGVTGPNVKSLRCDLWAEHGGRASKQHWADDFKTLVDHIGDTDSRLERYVTAPRLYPPGPVQRRWWQLSETSRLDRQ